MPTFRQYLIINYHLSLITFSVKTHFLFFFFTELNHFNYLNQHFSLFQNTKKLKYFILCNNIMINEILSSHQKSIVAHYHKQTYE
jgi:hypothetical protein